MIWKFLLLRHFYTGKCPAFMQHFSLLSSVFGDEAKGEQTVYLEPRKIFYFEILLSQVMGFCLTLKPNLMEIFF